MEGFILYQSVHESLLFLPGMLIFSAKELSLRQTASITTYLVDADGNAGALQYHMRMERVNTTMIGLLRREIAKAAVQRDERHVRLRW